MCRWRILGVCLVLHAGCGIAVVDRDSDETGSGGAPATSTATTTSTTTTSSASTSTTTTSTSSTSSTGDDPASLWCNPYCDGLFVEHMCFASPAACQDACKAMYAQCEAEGCLAEAQALRQCVAADLEPPPTTCSIDLDKWTCDDELDACEACSNASLCCKFW